MMGNTRALLWKSSRCLSPSFCPCCVPVQKCVCTLIHCSLMQYYPAEYLCPQLYFLLILDLLMPVLGAVFTSSSSPKGLLIVSPGSFVTVKTQTSVRGFGCSTNRHPADHRTTTSERLQTSDHRGPSSQQVQNQFLVN